MFSKEEKGLERDVGTRKEENIKTHSRKKS